MYESGVAVIKSEDGDTKVAVIVTVPIAVEIVKTLGARNESIDHPETQQMFNDLADALLDQGIQITELIPHPISAFSDSTPEDINRAETLEELLNLVNEVKAEFANELN